MIFLRIFFKMLTTHKVKILQSLDKKKFRQKYNLYLVEGAKIISEVAASGHKIQEIFTTDPDFTVENTDITVISDAELRKISFLKNPQDSVAICELREMRAIESSINLVADGIQDPGNLGTLIRLADWFGIRQIVCSEDTADVYNPKILQASMGSFLRVNVVYDNLPVFLKNSENRNVGTFMDGDNLYKYAFPEKINLILGNEGNGIRAATEYLIQDKIAVPAFGARQTESLNVSVAAAIILGQMFSSK